MASSRRLLAPHVLILQMLISRFQAARYRRPGLMLLIQRLVLISARAHRYMRFVSFLNQAGAVFTSTSLVVHTPLLAKLASRSCCLDSRLFVVRAWMRTVRMPCGILCTLLRSRGSPSDRCKSRIIMLRCVAKKAARRWSYGANKVQLHTDVKLLSEFLSCLSNDVGRNNPSLSSLSPSPVPRALPLAQKRRSSPSM